MLTKVLSQMQTVLIVLSFCNLVAAQGSLPARLNIETIHGDGAGGMCPADDQLEEARAVVRHNVRAIIREMYEPGTLHNPASACANISQDSPSGYYWIQPADSLNATNIFCDRTRTCCESTGGWMRIANLDMIDPNQQCPPEFREITSPIRTCGRPGPGGCVSTTFPVHGIEYSRVCGRVRGYQYFITQAFDPWYLGQTTIDDNYIDGVSITHGNSPRNHIWSFAAGLDEYSNDGDRCPCTNMHDSAFRGTIAPFIGQDYFCETGTATANRQTPIFYSTDPLWDGQGCGTSSTCCNHPLYFCKQLPQPTTDDIELRLCAILDSADSPLDQIEIYVQ